MNETARYALPLLSAGQAQKEVTHNEALLQIDRLLHVAVATRGLNVPPPAPSPSAAYIVSTAPTGAWEARADCLAWHEGGAWNFTHPVRGLMAWIIDEARFSVFDTGWSVGGWPASGLQIGGRAVLAALPVALEPPAGGAVVDAEARAAIAAMIAVLRDQGIVL